MEKGIKPETERLILMPLTYDQIQKYLRNDLSLEMEIGVAAQPRDISPALKEAREETFLPQLADPAKNYRYSTLWTIVLKSENRKNGFNLAGETEGTYAFRSDFQRISLIPDISKST